MGVRKVKKLIKSVVILAVLVLVAGLSALFLMNGMVKGGVETVLPKITGTPVKVESVNISVVSGKAEISGFLIGNPKGFETDSAFSLDGVRVALDLPSIFSDEIVIDEIRITAPRITYEQGLGSSNIGKIKEKIDKFASKGGSGGEDPGAAEGGSSKKVKIKRLILEDGEIAVSMTGFEGKAVPLRLPPVDYKAKDEESRPIGEVAQDLFGVVSAAIEETVVNGKDIIGKRLETLKQDGTEVVEKAKDDVEAALGGIGDLLKKK